MNINMNETRLQIDRHKLREYREAAGLSQADIAPIIGVTKAQVSNIEAGSSRITADAVGVWARTCNVTNVFDLYSDAAPNAFRSPVRSLKPLTKKLQ